MNYSTKRVTDSNGIQSLENRLSNDPTVGEIRLQKEHNDSICNICLNIRKLTYDHVPPKCTGNKSKVIYRNFFNYITGEGKNIIGRSKNGIKYQTICQKCNNEVLQQYDNEISKLFANFRECMPSNNIEYSIKVRPKKIMLGIIGHLLAAKTSHERSALDEILANFLKNPNKPAEHSLGFYVLPYFYPEIRIIRDIITSQLIHMNCLKIKPFAFIVTSSNTHKRLSDNIEFIHPNHNWSKFFNVDQLEEFTVSFFNTLPCPLDWPERYYKPTIMGKTTIESIIATLE